MTFSRAFSIPCLYFLFGKTLSELLQGRGDPIGLNAEGYTVWVLCALV